MTDLDDIKRNQSTLTCYTSRMSLKRDGKEMVGVCPFHSEKTPSFRVSSHQGGWVWRCFGACAQGGDIISFVQQTDQVSFKEALERVKKEIGQNSFSDTKAADKIFSSLSEPTKPSISYSLAEYNKFETALAENKEAKEWLAKRGISYDTARRLHIGYRASVGQLSPESHLRDNGWIAFPSVEGDRVTSIKYRSITSKSFCKQGGMAKGDNTPLFNSESIEPLEPIYLVEGELDCLTLVGAGYKAVSVQSASTPLTAANKEKLLEADYIILAGDNDPAGNEYMQKAWSEIQERVYRLQWPDPYKDANQVFLEACKGDVKAFHQLVEELTTQAKANPMPNVSDLRSTLKKSQRIQLGDHPNRWRWPWAGMDGMANIMPGSVVYLSSTNSGMGKTQIMMNASVFNALRGDVIINYSAELSNDEYAEIVVSHLLKKNRHQLTEEDYQQKAYKLLSNVRYYIGRNNDLNRINDVLDLVEAAVRRTGAGTVIMDTIHFVTINETDTIKAQENAMHRAKSMAQKYGLKWFNLGQPRKASQQLKGKPTHVTDAKGSEMLISASDVAYAIHRDCAKIDDPSKPPREPYQPLTQVFLQKGRSQGMGGAYTELMFNGDICTFFDIEKQVAPERDGLF